MTQRIEARIQPPLLTWAREAAGLDVETAADKVSATKERLLAWEAGELRPTINQLRNLGRVYRRPIAVFYLREPPAPVATPTDFRRLPGEVSGIASPELRYEMRQAAHRREIALELLRELGEEPLELSVQVPSDGNVDALASNVRAALGISDAVQRSWRGWYDSFNGLRAAIEKAGCLVLQMTDVPVDEARGFSLAERPLPVLVVNIKDAPRGRAFSLLHELTHVLLRQGGLCDLDETTPRDPQALQVEQYCNAVAGASLVPTDALLADPAVELHGSSDHWTDRELGELASRFGASREVVLRRLLTLGRTSPEFYRQMRAEFAREYDEAQRNRAPGFAPPAQMAVARAGPTFTGLVLDSYADGHITAGDVSDYLGVRLKHLSRIEKLVGSRGAE